MKFAVMFLVAALAAAEAQLQIQGGSVFGSRVARPVVLAPVVRKSTTVNRQYSSNSGNTDGQYRPDNSGAYNSDGAYHPDSSGSYVHQDQKYLHKDESYKHLADKFGGSGGGDGGFGGAGAGGGAGGQYQDSAYRGSGVSSGVSQRAKISHDLSSSVYSGVMSGEQKVFGPAGFGEAVTLQQGSAQGKYDNRNYGIIRQTGKVEEDGYQYLYETENGILGEEQGKLAKRDTDNEAMHSTGFFTYTGPDDIVYTVNYVADENGFQPDAAHLPTPPPVPEYIIRALDYQRSIGTLVD